MEIRSNRTVKLDTPTTEINIYGAEIVRAKQDKLGRMYITVK